MTGKLLRDIVNLMIYGGAFIGLCAASITALSFELLGGVDMHFDYIMLIGVSTAALYCAHRVIGLHKVAHVATSERYDVIKRYKQHIWFYSVLWVGLTLWFFKPMVSWNLIWWLIPGGSIALAYVLPFLSKGRRLRDLGWVKIILIGWSWGWLTAFLPAYYFEEIPLHLAIIHFIERMLFIIAITIPFEIRDMNVDRSVGLTTMPAMLGMKRTLRTGYILCGLVIMLAFFLAFHFFNFPYLFSMTVVCGATVWILKKSQYVDDDYFFGGLTDGLMIIALVVYWFIVKL